MKKSILIFCTVSIALSLTAFGISSWNEPDGSESCSKSEVAENTIQPETIEMASSIDFVYDVDSRFMATITKEDLHNLKSITSLLRESERKNIVSYESVRVSVLEDSRETDISASGDTEMLNAEQIKLLRSVNYSTNLYIRADFQIKNETTGVITTGNSTPHITVVPEKQAVYEGGKDALIKYLKYNSIHQTTLAKEGNLLAGKIYFTVGVFGTISDVRLTSSSGFPAIDLWMTDLISRAPGKWQPAENSNGERVNQTLVYSFGIMGC